MKYSELTYRNYCIHMPRRLVEALQDAFGMDTWAAMTTVLEARNRRLPNIQRLAREDIQVALRVARK